MYFYKMHCQKMYFKASCTVRPFKNPCTVRTLSPVRYVLLLLGRGMMMTLSTYIPDIFDQIEGTYCEKSIRDGAFIDHRSER